MKPSVTPLRYPGGKTWLLPYVMEYLRFHNIQLGTIIEPFAGSASISIGLLKRGLADKAYLSESDPLLVAFWRTVFNNNSEFLEAVRSLEISMETWYDFRKYLARDASLKYREIELALAFLFYNRTNYSGIIKAGPIGGRRQLSENKLQCRFNVTGIIRKIQALSDLGDKVKIELYDGIEFLRKIGRMYEDDPIFIYVDPPYYKAGKVLYRDYFTDKQHEELADVLDNITEYPWLVSYDDSEFIRKLYSKSHLQYVYTDYQAGNLKRGMKELLLSNFRIPPEVANSRTVSESPAIAKNTVGGVDSI